MAELMTTTSLLTVPAPTAKPTPHGAELALLLPCFVFVLGVALLASPLGLRWRLWFPGAESEKSLFKGVRAGVYTFLSHLN
jgi:light-harvesting complex 1 beta chain